MDSSNRYGGRRLAETLGPIGVWNWALQRLSGEREAEATRAFETLGYPVTWIPETLGNKELFSHAGDPAGGDLTDGRGLGHRQHPRP